LCCWGNLNQIKILFAGHFERVEGGQDTNLCTFVIYYPNFSRSNTIVRANKPFIDTILRQLTQGN
jgi:hypothetical protein